MHMAAYSRVPLRELDAALGPATSGLTGARRIALAALCRGLDAGIAPSRIRLWLTSRRPETESLCSSPTLYASLVVATRSRVVASSHPGARAEMLVQVSRRLVTHLLAPTPETDRHGEPVAVTPRAVNSARIALAVIGVGILRQVANPRESERSMESAMVTLPWLAARMGTTRVSARKAVGMCERLGWLSEVKRTPGGGTRYRLGRVRSAEDRTRSIQLDDLVLALADTVHGDDNDSLDVAWLLTADHPTWHYAGRTEGSRVPTDPDAMTWLVGLADAVTTETGVFEDPVEQFGLSARLVSTHRSLIESAGLMEEGVDPGAALTELGRESGAVERARTAELARREKSLVRTESMQAVRAERSVGRTVLDQALKSAGLVPGPDEDVADQSAWASALNSELAQVDDELRPAVRHALRSKMVRTGWSTEKADRVSERIVMTAQSVAA